MYLFNHCTVAMFRLTDLTEAINEMFKIGSNGIAFTYLPSGSRAAFGLGSCSCLQANMKEKPIQPFNKIVKSIFSQKK